MIIIKVVSEFENKRDATTCNMYKIIYELEDQIFGL